LIVAELLYKTTIKFRKDQIKNKLLNNIPSTQMSTKKEIFKKLRILITQKFKDPKEAFDFFDKNSDGYLSKKELKKLVKESKVNGFLSGIVASKMIEGLDQNKDKKFNWQEFKKAVDDLVAQGVKESA